MKIYSKELDIWWCLSLIKDNLAENWLLASMAEFFRYQPSTSVSWVFDDQLEMFCHLYYFEQSVSILLWCVVLGCWVLKRQSQAGFSDWVLQHTHSEPEHWQKDGKYLIWFECFQLIKEILGVIWYQIEPFWVVLIVCQHRLTTGKIGVALGGHCGGTAGAVSGHCTTTQILITYKFYTFLYIWEWLMQMRFVFKHLGGEFYAFVEFYKFGSTI